MSKKTTTTMTANQNQKRHIPESQLVLKATRNEKSAMMPAMIVLMIKNAAPASRVSSASWQPSPAVVQVLAPFDARVVQASIQPTRSVNPGVATDKKAVALAAISKTVAAAKMIAIVRNLTLSCIFFGWVFARLV